MNPAEPAGAAPATEPASSGAPLPESPAAVPAPDAAPAGAAASPQLELGIGEPAPVEPGRAPATP
jgi:hypothetical protein